MLEETVKLLELKINNVEKKSTSVQTEVSRCEKLSRKSCEKQTEAENNIRCEKCDHPPQDIWDIGAHVEELYSSGSDHEMISCHYCEATLKTKEDLIIHRKNVH